MDIRSFIITLIALLVAAALAVIIGGIRTILAANKLMFFRLRQARAAGGWRLLGIGMLIVLAILLLSFFGEPVAYHYFPPSPTISPTWTPSVVPTITLSPTITLTPPITDTPLVTDTPTMTVTPSLPLAIEAQFSSVVTPDPEAVVSPLIFATKLDQSLPADPGTRFENPIPHMYAFFSYDHFTLGVQWTAVWYRDGVYVYHETKPWDASTGGYGYSDWGPSPDQWLPGYYQVQIFVGNEVKRVGFFTIVGDAPTAAPTSTPSPTLTPTSTPIPSQTPAPTSNP